MNALTLSILFFLGVSILFYVLFAGADFGAGILELFLGPQLKKEQRKLILHAMAPVWEANHVWLILAIVILFMGFPRIYATISIYLYLPIIALLLGIIMRGCAFTFRYYDTLSTFYQPVYSAVFATSSLWASLFLGILAGAVILGRIDPAAVDFYSLYIAPWLNGFCITLGLFTAGLFTFLASVYLVGETQEDSLRSIFKKKAVSSSLFAMISGAAVFVLAETSGLSLANRFFNHPLSIAAFLATLPLWVIFWWSLSKKQAVFRTRFLAALIVALVLLGWFSVQLPEAVRFAPPALSLTFQNTAAQAASLKALLTALLVGSLIIFPALGYLLRIFKWKSV